MSRRKGDEPELAVALRYDGRGAPRVTAKGRGHVGRRILELAEAHGIPLYEEPALAQALSRIDLDQEIPRNLYVAVAEVIAFAYAVAGKQPPQPEQAPGGTLGGSTRPGRADGTS